MALPMDSGLNLCYPAKHRNVFSRGFSSSFSSFLYYLRDKNSIVWLGVDFRLNDVGPEEKDSSQEKAEDKSAK